MKREEIEVKEEKDGKVSVNIPNWVVYLGAACFVIDLISDILKLWV